MKNQEKSWKTRTRNWVAGGLCGLAALVSGCGSDNKIVDKSILKPYVGTSFVSDYVAPHGAMIKGQARQDLVNVNVNDRLSAFVWQNYSNKEGDFNERDFGVSYSVNIAKGLSASVGYQYWDYPTGTFGPHDNALKAGIKYSSIVDLKCDFTHLFRHDCTPTGNRYYLTASKTFPLGKIGGADISFTPSIATSLVDNYYGYSGNSQVTPGANLGINKKLGNGNLSLNFFINDQHGRIEGIHDHIWGGVSAGYSF